jgi:hypothetical protein
LFRAQLHLANLRGRRIVDGLHKLVRVFPQDVVTFGLPLLWCGSCLDRDRRLGGNFALVFRGLACDTLIGLLRSSITHASIFFVFFRDRVRECFLHRDLTCHFLSFHLFVRLAAGSEAHGWEKQDYNHVTKLHRRLTRPTTRRHRQ